MKGGGGGGGVPRFAGEAEDRSTAAFNRFRSRIFPRCGENGRNEGRNRSGNQATLAYVSRAHDTKQPGRNFLRKVTIFLFERIEQGPGRRIFLREKSLERRDKNIQRREIYIFGYRRKRRRRFEDVN